MTDAPLAEIGELTTIGPTGHELRPLNHQQLKQLLNNLNPARIAKRQQSGQQLSYLEAWDVRATLIRVFGFGGWSSEVLESEVLRIDEIPQVKDPNKKSWRVLAKATVRLTIHQLGAVYTETAAQSQSLPDIGEATDMALKTVESDALKRAAMNLGTQFGLSLYDSGSTSDVVKVVLADGQNADARAAMAAEWERTHPARTSQEAAGATGADPTTGEVPDGPTQAQTAAAASTVANGFGPQA